MSIKKIILALTGLGLVVIGFSNLNYNIEKNKNNRINSNMMANNEEKVAFNPNENTAQDQNKIAPKLQQNTGLPNEIPPAMLEAMKKQGITVDDLRGGGNKGQNGSMSGMGGSNKMSGMNGQFPEEMLKAIEEQNKQKANAQQNPMDAAIQKAVAHINSHNDKNEIAKYQEEMQIADKDPTNSENIISLAQRFMKHGEVKAAEIYLQKGIIASPSNPHLLYTYGEALVKDFQFEKAAEQWERALSIEASAEAHYNLGMLYRYKLNQEDKAKNHFKKAMTVEHKDKHLMEHLKKELNKKN